MNILMFTHERNLNGASKSMLNLIDELGAKGVNFYVVCPYREGPVFDALAERGITILYHDFHRWMRRRPDNSFKWLGICLKWKLWNRYCDYREALKIRKEIADLDINILHSNTSVINIGGILAGMTNIPHIWYVREFGKEDFNLHYLDGEKETYQYIGEHADCVVTISAALNRKIKQYIPDNKLELIYNGVGDENILEREYVTDGECSFLIAGTIQPGKGQDVAINAVQELRQRGYNNFKLYIAGRGDTQWLEPLANRCGESVVFLGQISDMAELRKSMNVELVCSKSEAFGRVTVEAMMGGMPVIGANTGGTPELINDGVTGFLYEQGDHLLLADKMQFFLDHPDMIEVMGREAQKEATRKYSIERCAEDVYKVYQKVVNSR